MPQASAETLYVGGHSYTPVAPADDAVAYPSTSWWIGAANKAGLQELNNRLSDGRPRTVVGISQGAVIVDNYLRGTPDTGNKYVVAADPLRPGGIVYSVLPQGTYIPVVDHTVAPPPETAADVDVVTQEYDGWADFPDRPWDVVSSANAVMGMGVVPTGGLSAHARTPVDPDTYTNAEVVSKDTNSKGGTTTKYLVRSKTLPLTEPLRNVGVNGSLVDRVDSFLKPIVDAGYSRNDK